jgi:hypothetical protein
MPSPATIVSTVPDWAGASAAACASLRPERRSEDRGADYVEPALDAAILGREDQEPPTARARAAG